MTTLRGAHQRLLRTLAPSAVGACVVAAIALHFTRDPWHLALWSTGGAVILIVALMAGTRREDMRARVAAAEEDAEMRALLHSTLESTNDGILTVDLKGNTVSHNQRFLELWGLPPGLATDGPSRIAKIQHELVDAPGFLRKIAEYSAAPGRVGEDLIEFRDGRVLLRTTLPHRLDGRIIGRVWSFRDITEQRRTETALAESERRFRRMVTNVPGVIFQFYIRSDYSLWFTYLSEGCQALLGVEPPSFPWRADSLIQRVHPDDMRRFIALASRAAQSLESWTWEGRVTLQSGVTRWLRAASRPTRHPDAKITWDGLLMDVTEEKLAAEALVRREEQLADAQEIAHIGSWDWDIETGKVTISAEHWRIFGYQPDEFEWSYHRHMAAIHSDDRERVRKAFETSLIDGSESSIDYRIVRPDGVIRMVTSRGRVVWDDRRRAARLLGTVQDVTEQKLAAVALERRVRAEQALTRAARLLSVSTSRDLTAVLEMIARAIGAERGYLFQSRCHAQASLMDATHEWHAQGVVSALPNLQALDTATAPWWVEQLNNRSCIVLDSLDDLPESAVLERKLLEMHGVSATVSVPLVDTERGLIGFIGFDHVGDDGTWSDEDVRVLQTTAEMLVAYFARQRSETALRESEERFRQMAESMREVFFMVSVDSSEVIYLSPSYEVVWGRPRSDTAAFVESILPEDRHILFDDMARSQSGEGDPLRFIEYRIARPDGSIRWIRHRTFQVLDAEGRPYRVTGVCSDITEQKQLEEELRRANRIEAIGHLAAGIAHEINTPIQYIGDNVRFLDESYNDLRTVLEAYAALLRDAQVGQVGPERLAEVAATLNRADVEYVLEEAPRASAQALDGVQRVAEIVRAMKEFSHPGTGQKVPTDLNHAILSTTTVARNEWKYLAELVTELDESLPPVACLPGEINQAILNLVVNAAHAIAERQKREGTEEPGVITVTTAQLADAVEIRVSDTGTGIPAEIRGRIFDPFFTTKEVGRGTGQGLTFVHSIVVEKHGGTVGLETELGVGTTFIVRLPSHASSAAIGEAA